MSEHGEGGWAAQAGGDAGKRMPSATLRASLTAWARCQQVIQQLPWLEEARCAQRKWVDQYNIQMHGVADLPLLSCHIPIHVAILSLRQPHTLIAALHLPAHRGKEASRAGGQAN